MTDWQPIRTLPANYDGYFAVGWWCRLPGCGSSWETDTDEANDSATHWTPLPNPPVQS